MTDEFDFDSAWEGEDENFADFSPDEDADPGTVAFLDQQAADFNAKAEHEFADRYGFVHKCRCDLDYTEGNLVEVTACYANMTLEALDACATLYAENKLLRTLVTKALGGIDAGREVSDGSAGEPDSGDPADGFA